MLALLTLGACTADVGVLAAIGDAEKRLPVTCSPQPYLKMNSEMIRYVFGRDCHRYVREVFKNYNRYVCLCVPVLAIHKV